MMPMLQVTTHTLSPIYMIYLHPADLVLYCEAFLTTYRTFISPEELIKKLQYRYPSPPVGPLLFPSHCFWSCH